ncbi:MAG: hypothetical protein ACYDBV_02765 [Nitrospiria bacterium]
MEQIQTVDQVRKADVRKESRRVYLGMVLFLALLQGVILLGPQWMGNWAHDNFHSYRHSVGMACH